MDQIDTSKRIPADEVELQVYERMYKDRVDSVFRQVGQQEYNMIALRIAQQQESYLRKHMPSSPLLELLDMARVAGVAE
jgi:hypothetical protein